MGTFTRRLRPARTLCAAAMLLCGARLAFAEETPPLVLVDGTVLDSGTLPPAAELFVRGSAALQGSGQGQHRHGHVFRSVLAANGAPEGKVCSLGAVDRAQTPSRSCSACHETAGHPVDVPYAVRAAGELRLRPVAQLPGPIALGPSGEVACTSCHDGQSARPHKTAFESSRMLCLACHEGPTTAQETALLHSAGPRLEATATVVTVEAPGEGLLRSALNEK